mmetsp:Transcript_8441/g.16928  ORF Transcript_8441/g.16928 Transcript_8441/m.16928 type:complete len:148 (-) Transcript_8441:53-496(-)|eukprot:CAMPEP_0182464240 /NCGR_PEP_ID=MMETSP1319-20130603/8426_1 /TAXON_ID=172717 /ORGANISM="Bolidomonas pacifica, Strain RCC208" /LENGTH=147 /DNA_ID=CAMNT_0024663871 /DNA_START=39 /DNA_END=482 /DNA_ORIENTATION=+
MVIKCDTCSFSDFKIYPGHGMRFIRRDGQPTVFITSKARSMYMQRKKPAKLTWTITWRRMNKKGQVEAVTRRRARKTTKFARAIVGASLEELKKKRNQRPEVRAAQREAALREVKSRQKAARSQKGGASRPKNQPRAAGGRKGGNRR